MKVFLVWSIDWENQNVLSAWTDRVRAEQEAERIKTEGKETLYGADIEVREITLDVPWSDQP